MRKRNRLAVWLAGAGLILGPLAGVALTSGAADAAACGTGGTTFANTHLSGTGGRAAFTQSNNWGGGNACLTVPDLTTTGGGAYTVQSQTVAWTGSVLAAPEIQIGCQGGACTTANGLDQAASTNPDPLMTWSYSLAGMDTTTSAGDAEFNEAWSTDCVSTDTSPASKLVVGVYLDAFYPSKTLLASYVKLGLANTGTVSIDGHNWYLLHVEHGTGATATYKVEFAAQTQITSVTSLDMKAFETYINANQSGWVTDGTSFLAGTSCLRELDADGEIWEGTGGGGTFTGFAGGPLGISGP